MSPLLAAASRFAERIKINALSREMRDGRPMWIKRRRWSARPIMACANRFFWLAGNRVRALDDPATWQRWEVGCFLQFHGDHYRAFAEGADAVAAEEMPGVSLALHLDRGALTNGMAAAAGRELRRAHGWSCAALRGPWSHGDPHAGNFLYDEESDRARLIDFEVMHEATLSPAERHADDLLVFLQDVIGRVPAEEWLPTASSFLRGYDRAEIITLLARRLVLPRGIPRLWWAVRTTYLDPVEITRRLEALRAFIAEQVKIERPLAGAMREGS